MDPLPLALVLVGAVAHAAWNLVANRAAGDVEGGPAAFVGAYTIVASMVLIPAAVIWLVLDPSPPTWAWLWTGAVSAVLHLGYSLLLQHSYAGGDLNLAYPVARAVGPLLTLVVAVWILGERVSGGALAGALVLIVGVSVIAWPVTSGAADAGVLRHGLVYGVLTGVAIASYTLWDDQSVNRWDVPPMAYYLVNGLVQLVILAPFLGRRRRAIEMTLRLHWRAALAVAVLSPFAYLVVLFAMQLAPVALVAALRGTSIVLVSLGGWLIFREPSPRRRLVGAAVVVVGAALVALV